MGTTKEWNEDEHPRGKTTEASTPGSFAPRQWVGGNAPRDKFDQMSDDQKMEHIAKGGEIADEHLQDLYKRILKADGGFTYQPHTGKEPDVGFAVSIFPERSFAVDADKLHPAEFVDYFIRNSDLLSRVENFAGAWHDPKTHKVFLDISRVTPSKATAERLAKAHDQIAYFDLGKGESVDVNRKAKSGGVV